MKTLKIGLLSLGLIGILEAGVCHPSLSSYMGNMSFGPKITSVNGITTIIPKANSEVVDKKKNVTNYLLPKMSKGNISIEKNFNIDFCGETTYLISIGINEYKNLNFQLAGAVDDAKNIIKKVTTQCSNTQTHLLLNKNASKENIIKTLKEVRKKAKSNDSILFFYSANGFSFKNRNYLLTYDSDMKNEQPLLNTFLTTSKVKKYFNSNKIKKGIMIFDVCTKIFNPNK